MSRQGRGLYAVDVYLFFFQDKCTHECALHAIRVTSCSIGSTLHESRVFRVALLHSHNIITSPVTRRQAYLNVAFSLLLDRQICCNVTLTASELYSRHCPQHECIVSSVETQCVAVFNCNVISIYRSHSNDIVKKKKKTFPSSNKRCTKC